MFTLQKLIIAKEQRIQDLLTQQESLGGGLSEVKVQTSLPLDMVGTVTAMLLDLINERNGDIAGMLVVQREIEAMIEKVERVDLKLVLIERYINLKRWEDIAAHNNFSWNTVHRKHREALEKVQTILVECIS